MNSLSSFELNKKKNKYFKSALSKIINFHYKNCNTYKKILQNLSFNPKNL